MGDRECPLGIESAPNTSAIGHFPTPNAETGHCNSFWVSTKVLESLRVKALGNGGTSLSTH